MCIISTTEDLTLTFTDCYASVVIDGAETRATTERQDAKFRTNKTRIQGRVCGVRKKERERHKHTQDNRTTEMVRACDEKEREARSEKSATCRRSRK